MLGQGQLDQAAEQVTVAEAGGFPQLRVHADRREPGNRVDFVQEDAAGALLEEKIHARHAQAFERAEG